MIYFFYCVILLGIVLLVFGLLGMYTLFFKGFVLSGSLKKLPERFVISDIGDYYISFPVQSDFITNEITLHTSKEV